MRETRLIGQSDLRAHFGLGESTSVTTLRIEWPSGTVSLANLARDLAGIGRGEYTDLSTNKAHLQDFGR